MSDEGGWARRYGGDGGRAGGGVVQRAPGKRTLVEARYPMQRKAAAPSADGGPAPRADAGGLPSGLRAGVEALAGVSMEGVQVHRDSEQPARMGALAFAQGRDIHLAPGQEAQLPHEAWHVAQQAQGRVQATTQMAGASVNDDDGLEHEADVMGAKALALGEGPGAAATSAHGAAPASPASSSAPIQGRFIGPLARGLMEINAGIIDPGGQTYFAKLRTELDDHAAMITVYQGPDTSYQPGTKALSLHPTLLSSMATFARQQLYGTKGADAITGAEIVSQLSTVAHELSHARDHLIKGKDISANVEAVIDTELRAWAVEAIDAHTVGMSVKDMDKTKKRLIDSWVATTPEILDDLAAHASKNEVADRLMRYIVRGLRSKDTLLINEWIRDNRKTLDAQLIQLQGAVAKAVGVAAQGSPSQSNGAPSQSNGAPSQSSGPSAEEKVRIAWMTWADEAAELFLKGGGQKAPPGYQKTIVGSFKDKRSFAQPESEAFHRTQGLLPESGGGVLDFIHAHDTWLGEALLRFYGKLPGGLGGTDWD